MKPSQGARELAEKLKTRIRQNTAFNIDEAAALIDEELRELLPHLRHKSDCVPAFCTCGLAALLEKWKQEKS